MDKEPPPSRPGPSSILGPPPPRPKMQEPPLVLPALPLWRQKMIASGSTAAAHKADELVRKSHNREEHARKQLIKLKARAQRELSRAASEAALIGKVCAKWRPLPEMVPNIHLLVWHN